MKKDAQSPAGHVIELYVLKTKTCRWDRKLGYMHLNYTQGIDIVWDTVETALHLGFIDNSVQGSFKLVNPDTGELLKDANGNDIKIRGRKNLVQYFRDNVIEWKKLYTIVYEKLSQKQDPFIKSFEEMLNINLNEKLGADISCADQDTF